MQYKCEKCHDTGSLNKFGPYYDCTSCDAAEQRVALEKFRDELREKGEGFDDIAFAIHQRALAMAPKQEANHINDVVKMVAPEGWKLVPEDPTGDMFHAAAKIDNEMFAGGSSHGAEDGQVWAAMYDAAPEAPIAAPAVANGALTDDADLGEGLPSLPEAIEVGGEGWGWEDFQSQKVFSVEHMFKYARAAIALAASANGSPTDERAAFEASKPTMHIKRNHFGMYENLYVHHAWEAWQDRSALAALVVAAGPDAALVKALEEVLEWYMVHGNLHHTTVLCNARAALSGAKGN